VTVYEQIRNYILNDLGYRGRQDDLVEDYPLLEKDVLDSMGVFQVVSFLEDEFSIEVRPEELVAENFETIASIVRLVESKQVA
jgi:acyl carrier protein